MNPSRNWLKLTVPLMSVALLLLACGPAPTSTSQRDAGAAESRPGPKQIAIGIQTEFAYIIQYGRVASANPGPERYWTFHSNLTHFGDTGDPIPLLCAGDVVQDQHFERIRLPLARIPTKRLE